MYVHTFVMHATDMHSSVEGCICNLAWICTVTGSLAPPFSRRRASNSWCIFPIIPHLDIKFQGTRGGGGIRKKFPPRSFSRPPHFEQGWIYRWTDITGLKPFFIRDRYLWKRGRFFRWRDRCVIEGIRGSFLYRFGWAAVIEKIFDLSSYVLSPSRIRFSGSCGERSLFLDFRRFSAFDSLDLWNE